MNNLIFSLNSTLPIFLMMVLGYLLRRFKMIGPEFLKNANNLNYKVTLPVLLLLDIGSADIRSKWDTTYVLFCAIATTICFFTIWGLTKLFMKDKSMTGAFVQASFRSSAAILGISFIQNMYGDSGMAPLMIIGTVPLFNIYSVIVLTIEGNKQSKDEGISQKLKCTIINICTNPIIIGILAGIVYSLLSIKLPVAINKTLSNIAALATPLALLCLGAGFEGKKALKKVKPTMIASLIKLLLLPAIFIPIACMLGFRDEKLVALLIMLASPTTISSYVMAESMHNDGVLTSSIIVATTFLGAFTLTGWIFILRTLELISHAVN